MCLCLYADTRKVLDKRQELKKVHPESYQSMQFLRLPFSCSGDYAVPLPDAASATVPTFFDVQLPRDLLRARSGPRESDILFFLIRGTRRAVRWPLQSRRKGTVAGTRRSVRCPRQSRREGTAAGTRRSARCPRQSRREGTAARTPTHSAISPPPPIPPCLSAGGLTRGSGQVHNVVMESGASLHVQHYFVKSTGHPTK